MRKSPRLSSIGAQMAVAVQLMKRKNHQALVNLGHNITMEQLAILEELNYNDNLSMTDLSKAVWKQNANITRIVDKLESQNLVNRNPVVGDRRSYLISITKEGKALFKEVIPTVFDVYKNSISCISKEEEKATLVILKKIIEHLA